MFGDLITWKDDPLPVANPLLVYAELLTNGDPRELETGKQGRMRQGAHAVRKRPIEANPEILRSTAQ